MPIPNYTYTSDVPQSEQTIPETQGPILSNFQAINELIEVNHVGFTSVDNYGKHKYTSFTFQDSDPSTGPGEMAIYSKLTPSGPNTAEIFYRYPNNGSIVQLTNSVYGSGYSLLQTNGYAFISEGLRGICWGKAEGLLPNNVQNLIPINLSGPLPMNSFFTPVGPNNQAATSLFRCIVSGNNILLETSASTCPSSVYWMGISTSS